MGKLANKHYCCPLRRPLVCLAYYDGLQRTSVSPASLYACEGRISQLLVSVIARDAAQWVYDGGWPPEAGLTRGLPTITPAKTPSHPPTLVPPGHAPPTPQTLAPPCGSPSSPRTFPSVPLPPDKPRSSHQNPPICQSLLAATPAPTRLPRRPHLLDSPIAYPTSIRVAV